jgi:predicted phage baseplate assembly protein
VLKTSVPYVSRVENRHAANGGTEAETVDAAKVRGPLTLRSTGRAVTAEDYEELAREVAPDAARLRCVPTPETGGVRLLVVPRTAVDAAGRPTYRDLQHPPEALLRRIADHLDARRVVGARLTVSPPRYGGVTVVTRLSAGPGVVPEELREAVLKQLYGYLSPLDGGPDSAGWPFGRAVQAYDLSAVISRVPGVGMVEEVLLFAADLETGRRDNTPRARIDLGPDDLVLSYQHQVRVQ